MSLGFGARHLFSEEDRKKCGDNYTCKDVGRAGELCNHIVRCSMYFSI